MTAQWDWFLCNSKVAIKCLENFNNSPIKSILINQIRLWNEIGPIILRLAHTRVPLLIKRIWSKSESGTNSLLLPWFYAPAVSRSHSWLRSDFFLFLSKKDIQFRCVLVRTLKILHVLVFRVWKRLSYRSKAGFMYQTSFYKIKLNTPHSFLCKKQA